LLVEASAVELGEPCREQALQARPSRLEAGRIERVTAELAAALEETE
jgi:hypothetical protein